MKENTLPWALYDQISVESLEILMKENQYIYVPKLEYDNYALFCKDRHMRFCAILLSFSYIKVHFFGAAMVTVIKGRI